MSKAICDFLLVINSNLGPILHRLATIHTLRTDDGQQTHRAKEAVQHDYSASKTPALAPE